MNTEQRPAGRSGKKTGKQILLVDYEKDFADALSIRLKSLGWSVRCADSPEEALASAGDVNPDLIIMDVIFSGKMDGYEASRILKQDNSLRKTPLILLTVKASEQDIEKGLGTGADCYFTKPLDSEKFFRQVKLFLGEANGS